MVSAKIKNNQFFPSSLLELVSVTSFPGSYEAMWDKTLVKPIIIAFTFSNTEFSSSKIVMNPLAYETEILPSLSFLQVVMQLRRFLKTFLDSFSTPPTNLLTHLPSLLSFTIPSDIFQNTLQLSDIVRVFLPLLALLSLSPSHSFQPQYITYSTTPKI